MSAKRLDRMLNEHWGGNGGYVRFKYYGEFNTMKHLVYDCEGDLTYVGNSKIDGSPVFLYSFDNIDMSTIKDFKSLNIVLRKIKIKHYSDKKLDKKEKSILSFFKFFMNAYDNYYIKGLNYHEIIQLSYIEP